MALVAIRSKAVILMLFAFYLMLPIFLICVLSLFCFCVWSLFCYAYLSVFTSFEIIWTRKRVLVALVYYQLSTIYFWCPVTVSVL